MNITICSNVCGERDRNAVRERSVLYQNVQRSVVGFGLKNVAATQITSNKNWLVKASGQQTSKLWPTTLKRLAFLSDLRCSCSWVCYHTMYKLLNWIWKPYNNLNKLLNRVLNRMNFPWLMLLQCGVQIKSYLDPYTSGVAHAITIAGKSRSGTFANAPC